MMLGEITMQAKALALARQGLPVFPCRCVDKRPLTQNGFKDASSDLELVHRWWALWPRAYVGAPTGDKFVVIDLDLQHVEALSWFETNDARLPLTRTHVTGSGGRHLLFKPNSKVGCTTSKLGPHIDTRGFGGYVIWWPACGLDVLHPQTLAEVPRWALDALAPAPTNVIPFPRPNRISSANNSDARVQGLVATVANAREGERNSLLFWAAMRIYDMLALRELDRVAGADALAALAEAAFRIGLARTEIMRTIASAARSA
jgi:bifunctional DNA primase/polymerase-like protein